MLAFALEFPEEFGTRVRGAVLADTGASDLAREAFGGLGVRVAAALRRVGNRYRSRPELAEKLQKTIQRYGVDLTFLIAWASNFGPGRLAVSRGAHRARSPLAPRLRSGFTRCAISWRWTFVRPSSTSPSLRWSSSADRDLLTPKTTAQALRNALPDARAIVITGAGHISMMERHGIFNEVLSAYLERTLEAGSAARTVASGRPASRSESGHRRPPRRPLVRPRGETGCTVVLPPPGPIGSGRRSRRRAGHARDGPSATRHARQQVHAVLLAGGSAFGLAPATGVVRWLADRHRGSTTGIACVPIVPSAVLFDLGVGDPSTRPGVRRTATPHARPQRPR